MCRVRIECDQPPGFKSITRYIMSCLFNAIGLVSLQVETVPLRREGSMPVPMYLVLVQILSI